MWTYIMASARGDPTRSFINPLPPNGRSATIATNRPRYPSYPTYVYKSRAADDASIKPGAFMCQHFAQHTNQPIFTTNIPPPNANEYDAAVRTAETNDAGGADMQLLEIRTTTAAGQLTEQNTEDQSQPSSPTDKHGFWRSSCYFGACVARAFCCRKRDGATSDWFLDKFGGVRIDDTEFHFVQLIITDPTLPSHYRWLTFVSLAVLYNLIFVIGRAVFWELNNNMPILWFVLDYVCDAIYILDTIIHAHEGYLEDGLLVTDTKKLRAHYMRTKRWRTDVISLIPTDLAYWWWSPNRCSNTLVPCPIIVRANRLFRLPRMWEWFERTETATGYPNVFRICKVVLAILVLIHWNACLYFAISYAIGFGSDNWVYNLNGSKNGSLTRQYIYSFYWSTLTLTTIGETPQPENDAEYLFVVADFLAGVLIFATIVGNIGSMISNMNVARVDFQNRMDGVKQYMAFRRVGKELEARVIRWFAYTWAQSGALDEERVLAALPEKLKAEIAIRVHFDSLRRVQIFQDCEPGLLEALVLKLRLQVFSPGDYICRKGDVGKEMYIVKRGRLQVVADDGKRVLATLGAGSVFGEVSVLEIVGNRTGNRRTANVRSLGYSDLFCLAKDDLWVALADYPEARASLTERGCQLLRKDGLLDEEVYKKARDMQDSMTHNIVDLQSNVDGLNAKLTKLFHEYARIKARLQRIESGGETEPAHHNATSSKVRPTSTRSVHHHTKHQTTATPGEKNQQLDTLCDYKQKYKTF